MKRILVNATNLIKGGGISCAVYFIEESQFWNNKGVEWHYCVSSQIYEEIKNLGIQRQKIFVFRQSPAKNIISRFRLKAIERRVLPDMVYTIFGPAYVKFDSFHIMGVANTWLTKPKEIPFTKVYKNYLDLVFFKMSLSYKRSWLFKADSYICETQRSAKDLAYIVNKSIEEISVVPNINTNFGKSITNASQECINNKILKLCNNNILMLSSYYPHKNFENVIKACVKVREKNKNFKLLLTIEDFEFEKLCKNCNLNSVFLLNNIENLGKVKRKDLFRLYSISLFTVIPSFKEDYSSVYSESIESCTPLIASDYNYVRDILGGYAVYVDPNSIDAIHDGLVKLLNNDHRDMIIKKMRQQVMNSQFKTTKFELYMQIFNKYLSL
ncbi:glycosyltransferase [Thalassotalea crassostreae]|uniref:glycosyltransferase n=1 Tax=Thalassotalea crassostreae TaxID=1763536 RepID=UPI000838F26B|nr:glycosyltransferase [Thalassotalea crassostreae]